MKSLSKKLLAVFMSVLMAVSFAAVPLSAVAAESKEKNYVEGEAIVVLKNTAGNSYLKASRASSLYGSNIKLKNTYSFTGRKKSDKMSVAVLKSTRYSTKQLIKKLRKNPAVKYAFANSKKKALGITDDSYSKYQWALENNGQNGGTEGRDVNAEGLWEKAASSKKEQVVVVADTGLDLTSPEFKDVVWENKNGSRLLGKHGYDFVNGDTDPQDDNGHGTHCAGIIAAAADNQTGISGINKSNVKIMPLKWLDSDGGGFTEDVLAAYDYVNRALDLGENITAISNSWGGLADKSEIETFKEIFDKFGEKGAISLVAAGNEAYDLSEPYYEEDWFTGEEVALYDVPANCGSEYQLTVAATNEYDELAAFSNYSATEVDVAAPGVDILSTVSYNCFNPGIYDDEKKAAVVSQMQDYNDVLVGDVFGSVKPMTVTAEDTDELFRFDFSTNVTIEQSDKHFGLSGRGLTITTEDEIVQPEHDEEEEEEEEEEDFNAMLYCFEVPYTVSSAEKKQKYSVSLMVSGNKEGEIIVYDVPKDKGPKDIADLYMGGEERASVGTMAGGVFWDHLFFEVDPSKDKATERKLIFFCMAKEKETEFTIDDLAISTQGVSTSEFERYDYYCGTSMATPYVAGAVALVRNAYPDANIFDVINMVKNTGRAVEGLKDKVESGRVISLENLDKLPPLIGNAAYNDKGAVSIKGSFKDITSVKINGKEVKPTSSKANEIIVPDNKYSTNNVTIEVANDYGSDSFTTLLSNKKLIEKSSEIEGVPMEVTDGFMLPAGDAAYYINEYYNIGKIAYDNDLGIYVYDDMDVPQIDVSKLFEDKDDAGISGLLTSAAYSNNKIYFTMLRPITTSATGLIIGYDNCFASLDLSTGETVKLGEIPEDAIFGSSLGAYNGTIYLAGGYDDENNFSDTVYIYNASKKVFDKASSKLPEGRAFTSFIQYENKLYGVYGAVKDGGVPGIISFDGKAWSSSKLKLTSDDFEDLTTDTEKPFRVYTGNLGIGKNGLFLNGVYVYGYGDTYEYDVKNDKLVASDYAAKNELDGTKLIGTTLPGCFIGYEIAKVIEDDVEDDSFARACKVICGEAYEDITDGGFDDDVDFEIEPVAYKLDTETSFAKVIGTVKNAKVVSKANVAYGDNVTVKVVPNKGYAVQSVTVNGKTYSKTNTATVVANTANLKVSASVKLVAPAKVKGVKVKLNGKKATITWKKAKRAKGYQIQQYKNGKWKTVKTIKKASAKKCVIKKVKKGTKFRVRAYSVYEKKTYNGKWSKAVKAK